MLADCEKRGNRRCVGYLPVAKRHQEHSLCSSNVHTKGGALAFSWFFRLRLQWMHCLVRSQAFCLPPSGQFMEMQH